MGKLRLGGMFAGLRANVSCFTWLKIPLLALQTHSFLPWEILAFHCCKAIQLHSSCRPKESLVLLVGWSLMEGEESD